MIDSKDVSVVVQGAVNNEYIAVVIDSIKKYLPKSEVVLSTWEGSNVENLKYDVLVLNEDPGSVNFYRAEDSELPGWIDKNLQHNLSRQIVSSRNGIEKANIKYVLKILTNLYNALKTIQKEKQKC